MRALSAVLATGSLRAKNFSLGKRMDGEKVLQLDFVFAPSDRNFFHVDGRRTNCGFGKFDRSPNHFAETGRFDNSRDRHRRRRNRLEIGEFDRKSKNFAQRKIDRDRNE